MRRLLNLAVGLVGVVTLAACHGSGIAVDLPGGADDAPAVSAGPDAADATDIWAVDPPVEDAYGVPDIPELEDAAGPVDVDTSEAVADDAAGPPTPAPPPLLITELSAGDDWLELHNPTDVPVPLEGFHLTDDLGQLEQWTLPAVTIPAFGYLVVYASGKDVAAPGEPLHTNFKLSSGGEELALVAPDGQVVHAWAPFPPQPAGASWGVTMEATSTTLIAPGHAVRYRAPASADDPGPGWTEAGFDDASPDWSDGTTGLGYQAEAPPPGELLGDSMADFSGTQGQGGWSWGYYDATADADGQYAVDELVPFPAEYWTGSQWDWPSGNPPWDELGAESGHPNGINNGAEHWVIRRFEVPEAGTMHVEWHARKTNPGGAGVTAALLREGALIDVWTLAGGDTVGVTREVLLPYVGAGERLDLALTPVGPDGDPSDGADGSATRMRVSRAADETAFIETDVSATLEGHGTALFVRAHLDPGAAPDAWNRLLLTMRYDDAFAAWLGGERVASRGTPEPLGWDSVATEAHGPADAVDPEVFDLTSALTLLSPEGGVLALQGLKLHALDPSLLLLPELEAREVVIDSDTPRYFDEPTPGADNLAGPASLGPLIIDPTRHAQAGPGDAIVVKASVLATGAPIASVTLTWRVMFGAEVEVPMTPNSGVYQRVIPVGTAQPGQMIRWSIRATDDSGATGRAPAFADPLDSEAWYGTVIGDPAVDTSLPLYLWFAEDPEAAGTSAGTRCALFYAGELYDNVRFDIHGQSTQGFPKKSYNVDFNKDHRFLLEPGLSRMKDLNLLTNWADKTKLRNTLAYEVYRDAAADHHLAHPVHLRLNGAFFGVYDFVEDGDDVWLERLGRDPEGALYKMYNTMSAVGGAQKKTRLDEGTDDLQALIDGTKLTPDARRVFLYDHVDLAAMTNYVAAMTITSNVDCCHKNYYAYRDTRGTGEWFYMPWDLDLTFGHNWTGDYFDDAFYWDNGLLVGGNNALLSALYAMPEFVEMVMRRIRSLMDQQVQPPGTSTAALKLEARILELALAIGVDGDADNAGWPTWGEVWTFAEAIALLISDYVVLRRTWLYSQVELPTAADPTVLLSGDATVRWHVPTDDSLGASWRADAFDDAAWPEGPFAIGYENEPADYASLLQTWAKPSEADPAATAILVRARFDVPDPAGLEHLTLRVRYDDGFIAWIGGQEAARRNHPDPPAWDLTLPNMHPDHEAVSWEDIDISGSIPSLVAGENVLAIRVVNVDPTSSDMLLAAELVDAPPNASGGPIPLAQGPLTLAFDTAGLGDAADQAWMSITNTGPTALDLTDHVLSGPASYALRPGTVLPAGGTLYLAADVPGFRARPASPTGGEGLFVQGPYEPGPQFAAPSVGPVQVD